MQRKTRILNYRRNPTRNGFAMIMAIFFMIIMATLMLYMLGSTTETAQRTTNDYLQEQAQLIAKSATEYAILKVSGYNRAGPDNIPGNTDDTCLDNFTATYPASLLNVTVNISYFGFGAIFGCSNIVDQIQTPESNGTMLIDVYVESDSSLHLDEPVRYHRRTLQKL